VLRVFFTLFKIISGRKTRDRYEEIKSKISDLSTQKSNLLTSIEEFIEKELNKERSQLKKLPKSEFRTISSIDVAIGQKQKSLLLPEQLMVVDLLKKFNIVTNDYSLRAELLNKLLQSHSVCYYCGGKVKKVSLEGLLLIACYNSTLVNPRLLSFTKEPDAFINDVQSFEEIII